MKKLYTSMLLLQSGIVMAQTKVDLNPVSVTSNRLAQKTNESGRSITVIDGKDFQQLPVYSVDELLRYVPGVEVQSRGPLGSQSDIVIRGGTYQQVLVLLDGVKINDPLTGHFNGNMPVAPYEIDRIEVLRGPAAATYGAEAVGGVINIITKNFNRFDTAQNTQGQVKIVGGEYKLYGVDAGLRITGKKANGTIGLLSNNTEGQLLRSNTRGYSYNNTIGGSISFRLPYNWNLSVRSSYDNRDFAAQNFYTTYASDNATEKVTALWSQVQLIQQKSKGSQQIDAVYKKTTDYYLYNEKSTANENNSGFALLQYINNHQFSNRINTSLGGQFSQRSIQSNDRGNHNTAQGALFGTLLYRLNSWNMSGSLRGEYDQNYGFALLPQANISYVLPKITLRANAGKAIRSADFTERYNNYNKASVAAGSIGNPDLAAEQSWSYELGATLPICNYVSLNAAAFLRQQDNLIDWVNTPYAQMPRQENLVTGANYALAKNIKDLNTKGVELQVLYSKTMATNHRISSTAGITYLNSQSSDPNPSFYILAHAKWLMQASLLYQFKGFNFSANMMYKERKPFAAPAINASVSSSYCLVNAQAGYSFAKKWNASLRCNNIGNIQYADLLGSKMPNRWWSVSLMYRF